MKTLNLTYALRNNSLVHISEVERGLECGCICPACGEKLIAKKGSKVMHHFAHKSTVECEYGYQTSLHLAAKRIISKDGIMRVPALYLTFPQSGKKELLETEKVLKVSEVILEKKLDNIIPDILLITDIGKIIVEIFVTHEIDLQKKKKIKALGIPTIEIDLSKINRDISDQYLHDILINGNDYKSWIYNGKREEYYRKFLAVSELKPIISRNYALHVDNCPISKRVWKKKCYANFLDDCLICDYFVGTKTIRKSDNGQEQKILCAGKQRVAHIEDFDIPFDERIKYFKEKRELEFYELIVQGICPQCESNLVIRDGKYGEFFGCSNYPHCRFTFRYDEDN